MVRSGKVPGSSAGDRVPIAVPVPARRPPAVPGSRAATAGDEVRAPSRKPSSRSAWTSVPTASTSVPSRHRYGLC